MCVIKKGAYSLILFLFGGIGYSFIEVLLGGFCYLLMGILAEQCCGRLPLWFCCFFATLSITFLEFITGCVVNLGLGWDVWNYADQPLNLMGQVCLGFTSLWFLLSIPVSELAFWMRKKLNRL